MILREGSVVGDGCFEWRVLAVIFLVALDFAWGDFFGGGGGASLGGREGFRLCCWNGR